MHASKTQEDRFWAIVDRAQPSSALLEPDANEDHVLASTRAQLARLSDVELAAFANELVRRIQHAASNDGVLRLALLLADGGLSDDAYVDFCAWLVSLGRAAYERVLQDADALGAVVRLDVPRSFFFEEFAGLPKRMYRERTGRSVDGDALDSARWAKVNGRAQDVRSGLPRVSEQLRRQRGGSRGTG